jgi:acetyl-CoA acetyltransferase
VKGVAIAGIGMTQFGKQVGRGVRSLALAAIEEAIADSGLALDRIDRIYFGNAISGIVSQQEMIRGQVALRHQALGKVPLFNIENACASGGSAFSLACEAVASGAVEVALVIQRHAVPARARSRRNSDRWAREAARHRGLSRNRTWRGSQSP